MSNAAHTLDEIDPRLRPAAAALANARGGRRGAPMITDVLDVVPGGVFDALVEDARAVLAALDGLPPQPRARGPLNIVDASALGNDVGAVALRILARQADGSVHVVVWGRGQEAFAYGRLPSSLLWSAFAKSLADLETVLSREAES